MAELNPLFTLGIGGVIAALVLYWKRVDDKAYSESLKEIIARMEKREADYLVAMQADTSAKLELASAIRELKFVDRLEKRFDADDYLDPTEKRR